MPDIASLSVRIESTEAKKGAGDLDQLTASAKRTEAAVSSFEKRFAELAQEAAAINKQMQEASRILQQVAESTRATSLATGGLGAQLSSIEAVIAQEAAGFRSLAAELRRVTPAATQAEQSLQKTTIAVQEAEAPMRGLAEELGSTVARYATFAAAMGAIGHIAGEALKFSTAMAQVNTVLSDHSQIDSLTKSVQQMSGEFARAPAEQARALYDIVSAGYAKAAKAANILATANKLAIGGVADMGIAASGLTTVLSAYGASLHSSQEAADAMFVSAAAGKTTIEELSRHIGLVAPIAAQAGVAYDQLLAATGALTKNGLSTAMSMEGLRSMLSNIIRPAQGAQAVASNLGLAFNAAALQAKGLSGFMADVSAKVGDNIQAMAQLFPDVQAVNVALSLTGSAAGDFRSTLDSMLDKMGETDKAFAIMAATPEFAIQRIVKEFQVLETKVGGSFLGAANGPLHALANNFDAVENGLKHLAEGAAAFGIAKLTTGLKDWGAGLAQKVREQAADRASTVETAIAQTGYKRTLDESTAAALRNAAAELERQRTGIQAAMVSKTMTAQEAQLAFAEYQSASASLAEAAAMEEATVASRGLGAALDFMGGPLGLVAAAVSVAAFAFMGLKSAAEESLEATKKWAQQQGEVRSKQEEAIRYLKDEVDQLKGFEANALSTEAGKRALDGARSRILSLGEAYETAGVKGATSLSGLLAAAERVAQSDFASKVAEDAKRISEVQQQIAAAKASIQEAQDRLNSAPVGTQGAQIRGLAEGEAASAQASLASLQEQLKTLREKSSADTESQNAIDFQAIQALKDKTAATQALVKAQVELTKKGQEWLAHLRDHVEQMKHAGEASEKFSAGYKGLTVAQKKEADALIAEKDALQQAQKAREQHARGEEFIQSLRDEEGTLRGVNDGFGKYAAQIRKLPADLRPAAEAQIRLNEALQSGNDAAKYLASHAKDYSDILNNVPKFNLGEGPVLAALGHMDQKADDTAARRQAAQLASLEKQLKSAEDLQQHMTLVSDLYHSGRIDQATYYGQLIDYLDQTSEGFRTIHELGQSVASDLAQGFVAMANGTKDAFSQMVQSILADLERIAANKLFETLLNGVLDVAAGAIGGGGISGSPPVGVSGGLGGISNGIEGLALRAPSAPPPVSAPITINIKASGDGSADSGSTDGSGETMAHMQRFAGGLRAMVERHLQEQMRPGGSLDSFVRRRGG